MRPPIDRTQRLCSASSERIRLVCSVCSLRRRSNSQLPLVLLHGCGKTCHCPYAPLARAIAHAYRRQLVALKPVCLGATYTTVTLMLAGPTKRLTMRCQPPSGAVRNRRGLLHCGYRRERRRRDSRLPGVGDGTENRCGVAGGEPGLFGSNSTADCMRVPFAQHASRQDAVLFNNLPAPSAR